MREKITHPLPPVWNSESLVLLLGTMPSPKSREAGFFYMHPQNRFWRVLPAVFGETLSTAENVLRCANATKSEIVAYNKAAIAERRDFLLRHNIALWDVLAGCQIEGAADSSIKNAVPNDFAEIFAFSKIRHVFFTGKTAATLWKKHCATRYVADFCIQEECLPSTSPANARFTLEMLLEEYKTIRFALNSE